MDTPLFVYSQHMLYQPYLYSYYFIPIFEKNYVIMKKISVIVLAMLSFVSCGNATRSQGMDEAAVSVEEAEVEECSPVTQQSESPLPPPPSPAEQRKLIATGNVEFKVDKEIVDSVYNNINILIEKFNGYKSKDSKNDYSLNISAAIPSASFNEFVDGLNNVGGKLIEKNVTIEDVTNSYKDMVSSIKSKEAALDQYRVLLKRAGKISEIIEIQSKIDAIQEELDRINGKKISVDRQIAYSEVNINLRISNKVVDNEDDSSFFSKLGDSIIDGWEIIKWCILLIFRLWPLVLIGTAVYYFLRRRKKQA